MTGEQVNSAAKGAGRSVPAPLHYAFKYLINPVMKVLLRSPAHGLVSEHLLLLTFRGRKSGRAYTTPVGYTQEGNTVYVTTQSPWWRNLREGVEVRVRLRGEVRQGCATATREPEVVARFIEREMEAHGMDHARRRYRIEVEGDRPGVEQLEEAVAGTVLISIELNGEEG